jgi:hypothetical protein
MKTPNEFAGVNFARPCDLVMACTAAGWMTEAGDYRAVGRSFRPPLVVISGPPDSGKTYLARRMFAAAGLPPWEIPAGGCVEEFKDEIWQGFAYSAARERAAVLLDNVGWPKDGGGASKVTEVFCRWIDSDEWVYRPYGKIPPLALVTIITTTETENLPPELQERAVHVRLSARGKEGPADV